jgi:hypothetical protein
MTSKMPQASVAVVHLVRRGNPEHFFQRFTSSYLLHPAGMEHSMQFILKGVDDLDADKYRRKIDSLIPSASVLVLDDRGFDITAYRIAASLAKADFIVFLNSYAAIEADGWLEKLMKPLLKNPAVGVVGATGNWETIDDATPFPNAHIRTNGFAIRRSDFLSVRTGSLDSKFACQQFEAGVDGLTQQLLSRGMEPYVVDKNGKISARDQWPHSRTFRSGDQELLLISDNRTRQYQYGSSRHRMKLAKLSWDNQAMVTPLPLARKLTTLFHRVFAVRRS